MDEQLAALGPNGRLALDLDAAVDQRLADVEDLSSLTTPLLTSYVERVRRPLSALPLDVGLTLGLRGYLAQQLLELEAARFGIVDIPVMGGLPERPPQDLLVRVVKASRGGFWRLRALNDDTWNGFVGLAMWRAHKQVPPSPKVSYPMREVVDGLLRVGWLLRQVDLFYKLEPELSGS